MQKELAFTDTSSTRWGEIWYVCLNMNGLQGTINFFAVAAHSGGQGGYFSPHLLCDRCCALVNSFLHRAIVTTSPGLP